MDKIYAQAVELNDGEDPKLKNSRIILGISEDGYVHYDSSRPYTINELSSPKNNFWLRLNGYDGKLFIPRDTSLDINTDRDIEGIIASPSSIYGRGHIDAQIGSGLELSVDTKGLLIINDCLHNVFQSSEGYNYFGRDFNMLNSIYKKYQEESIKKKIFMDIDLSREFPTNPSTLMVDTCHAHNLVYICKEEGIISVQYRENKTQENEVLNMVVRDSIRYLQIAMQKAVIDERFEKAGQIKQKIQFYKDNINRWYNKKASENSIQLIFQKVMPDPDKK